MVVFSLPLRNENVAFSNGTTNTQCASSLSRLRKKSNVFCPLATEKHPEREASIFSHSSLPSHSAHHTGDPIHSLPLTLSQTPDHFSENVSGPCLTLSVPQ